MKHKFHSLFFLVAFILSAIDAFAIKETYTSSTKIGLNELLNPSNPYLVVDGKYSIMQNLSPASTDGKTFENLFYNHKIINRFKLRINKDDHKHQPFPYAATVKVGLTIEWYNPSISGFQIQTFERVLKVNYDPLNPNANETVLEFAGLY